MPATLPMRGAPMARQRGVGLIEVMVGILIGMVVVLVIFNTLIVAETYKRSTIGVSDAQITGQLTQFVLGRELANGGNGIMAGITELAGCNNWRLRPIPALVTDGGSATASDAVTVFYSNAPTIVHPVSFGAAGVAGTPYQVISPNGFKVGDWVIATQIATVATTTVPTDCTLVQVTDITQPPPLLLPYPPAGGGGRIALSYTLKAGTAFDFTTASRAVNLGPRMTRTLYSVNAAKRQLDSLDDNPDAVVATAVPVAQNVVLMKVQYGIDADGDPLGLVDCWTSADNSNTCANGIDYSDTAFQIVPAPPTTTQRIRSIRAVRIAIVVRSEDDVKQNTASGSLLNQTATLFSCPASIPRCSTVAIPANTVLENYRRYRIYETTIPLRNSLWNQP